MSFTQVYKSPKGLSAVAHRNLRHISCLFKTEGTEKIPWQDRQHIVYSLERKGSIEAKTSQRNLLLCLEKNLSMGRLTTGERARAGVSCQDPS